METNKIFFILCSIVALVTSTNFCKDKKDGSYAYSGDCSKFIKCLNSIVYNFNCPTGLQYDKNSRICNWASMVKCHPPAKPCDPNICKLPTCRCSMPETPGNIPDEQTPKMVTFTMDDGLTQVRYDLFQELLTGKTNPNGCPVKTTHFVSGDNIVYALAKKLYDEGHEIGVHTKSHRFPISFWRNATYAELLDEIVGMRTQLQNHGIKNLIGYRQPFLQTAGDTTFSVLKDYGFKYDASVPTNFGQFYWPHTLDYDTIPKPCVIPPCPKNSYPGLWEISMIPLRAKQGSLCVIYDDCGFTLKTADDVYEFFKKNFNRHFEHNRAPFPMYGHARWLLVPDHSYRKEGLKRFLKEMYDRSDVYFVSMAQTIEWMKNPKTLHQIKKKSGPLSC